MGYEMGGMIKRIMGTKLVGLPPTNTGVSPKTLENAEIRVSGGTTFF
eukprot:SAG22_NODE_154_length_17189_cov_38.210064_7_plen_47_part_00